MQELILEAAQQKALADLRRKAAADPVDVLQIVAAMQANDAATMDRHTQRMKGFMVTLPVGYLVCFTIETGHRAGAVRHMSLVYDGPGAVPSRPAVEAVMEHLGFSGGVQACNCWTEQAGENRVAVSVAQPVTMTPEVGRA